MNNPRSRVKGTATQDRSVLAYKSKAKRTNILISAVLILVVVLIVGIAIYRNQVAPFKIVVLEVNDTQIEMGYFLKRVAMSGEPAMQMLNTLSREQMIKLAAENPPFNISVTEEALDRYARDIAAGVDGSISEEEFKEWYRQQLNTTRLIDAEFRDLLRTSYLGMKMGEYLAQFVPTHAEQAFVNMIFVENFAIGTEVREKYEAGEDFAALALEYSVDKALGSTGGKVGWVPHGILEPIFDEEAFSLDVGGISNPISLDQNRVVVMMVSERAADREIDESLLAVLKSKVLDDWYRENHSEFEVHFHGFDNGYDSETDAWVNWQLMRMQQQQAKS